MPTYSVSAPDGNTYSITGPEGATQEQVQAEVLRQNPSAGQPRSATAQPAPAEPTNPVARGVDRVAKAGVGMDEAALNLGSQAIATPVAGIAGLLQGAKNRLQGDPSNMSAADRIAQVQGALTYQPRTDAGKAIQGVVAKPAQWLAAGADKAGQAASDATGSPAIGAAVNTGVQALPALLMKRTSTVVGDATAEQAATTAASRAQSYAGRIGLDWDSLSDSIKTKLTGIAQNAGDLAKLDSAGVKREAQLQSLAVPVPATRGQLLRDPVQLRNEGNASATNAGAPIRNIHLDQNQALLDNLDALKKGVSGTGDTAATTSNSQQTGASIQGAARAKLAFQQAKVKQLYQAAQDSGETAKLVDTTPIENLIAQTPDQTHYGYAKQWIKQNAGDTKAVPTTRRDSLGMQYEEKPGAPVGTSINDLEDLRKAAVAKAMNGGEDGYYAGKLISAIDTATEGAGGDLYKSARAARKAQALEFGDQGAVADLVDNSSRTDRATALENTTKAIANGSIEDVQKVKKTLLEGGDATTQQAGQKAWNDLRAQLVQDIKDKATRGASPNERGVQELTAPGLKRAIDSYGPQKLNEIFGPEAHRQLSDILDATQTVKTVPPSRVAGSSTVANAMAFLEKAITRMPGGGMVADLARGATKLRDIGAVSRDARAATMTPLSEVYSQSSKSRLQAADVSNAKKTFFLSSLAGSPPDR